MSKNIKNKIPSFLLLIIAAILISISYFIFISPALSSCNSGQCATFISQSVPTTMTAGSSVQVSVTMRNDGPKTWTGSSNHRLGSQNPRDNLTWGIGRVDVSGSVPPGASHTFAFNVTAPSSPGTYNFQWQMLQEFIAWFGEFSPNVAVNVVSAPPPPPPGPPPPPPPPPTTFTHDFGLYAGPAASNVTVTQPNYCLSGPAATVNWDYSDSGGSPQSAYQVQIDEQASFQTPEWDSGKVSCSGCRSNSTPQGILQFNTTYKARVRVWNSFDTASSWTESGTWKTPLYAYPQVNFIFAPAAPGQQQIIPNDPVQFTDQTQFFDSNPQGHRWAWLFGDGGASTQQNPQHSFASEGIFNTTLTATDNANQSCSITKPINIQLPNPIWKEVNPGG